MKSGMRPIPTPPFVSISDDTSWLSGDGLRIVLNRFFHESSNSRIPEFPNLRIFESSNSRIYGFPISRITVFTHHRIIEFPNLRINEFTHRV